MNAHGTSFSRVVVMMMMLCLLLPGTPALADTPPAPASQAVDTHRADEWQRREILNLEHGRPSEQERLGYLDLVVIPLLLLMLIMGLMRLRNF